MGETGRTVAFSFAFEPPLDTWARWCAVVPTRSYVRVDDHGFEAVYGLWRVATTWSNVVGIARTGPYRAWKVAGPPRVSWADRGITMAASTVGGACLRFRDPVRGLDPLGLVRHPAATLAVDDIDGFVATAQERIAAVLPVESAEAPGHEEGRYLPALRAIWNWNRRHVNHHQRSVERVDVPDLDRAGDVDDQPIEHAVGPTFHRRYRYVGRGAAMGADEAMAAIQSDPNVLADAGFAPFTQVRGASGAMRVGDRYVIQIAGPWKGAVEVIDVTSRSLRLATLEGHMETGVIEMRTSDDRPGDVALTIESWARSHDRFLDLMFDKLGIAKALQSEMWSIACERFGHLVGGVPAAPLEVVTQRAG